MKTKPIKVIHNAPKKKGKVEVREFKTLDEVVAYMDRQHAGRLKPGRFQGR